jgi:hypothetical protein
MGGRLDGKVSIVTGAGSGIGKATAIRYAEEGARVTCVDIDGASVEATAAEIGEAGFAVAADIADAAQVRAYTDGTVERWGRLDVAFSNAGVNLPGVYHEASDEVIGSWPMGERRPSRRPRALRHVPPAPRPVTKEGDRRLGGQATVASCQARTVCQSEPRAL